MKNKIGSNLGTNKTRSNLGANKLLVKLALILAIVGTTNDSLAQNTIARAETGSTYPIPPAKNETVKDKNAIKNLDANNPLVFAEANIEKYFPDMVDYTKDLMNSFWNNEQRNAVASILSRITKKYVNPEKRIRFIIGAVEANVIMNGTAFSDKYRTDPSEEDMQCYEEFQNEYKLRFDTYERIFNENLGKLQQRIKEMEENNKEMEENNKEMEENNKEMEETIKANIEETIKILETFSVEDIQNNKIAYESVRQIKEIFRKEKWESSTHVEKLFSIIK